MIEWVTAATRTVWGNVRELPETVSQWQTYVELIDPDGGTKAPEGSHLPQQFWYLDGTGTVRFQVPKPVPLMEATNTPTPPASIQGGSWRSPEVRAQSLLICTQDSTPSPHERDALKSHQETSETWGLREVPVSGRKSRQGNWCLPFEPWVV